MTEFDELITRLYAQYPEEMSKAHMWVMEVFYARSQ